MSIKQFLVDLRESHTEYDTDPHSGMFVRNGPYRFEDKIYSSQDEKNNSVLQLIRDSKTSEEVLTHFGYADYYRDGTKSEKYINALKKLNTIPTNLIDFKLCVNLIENDKSMFNDIKNFMYMHNVLHDKNILEFIEILTDSKFDELLQNIIFDSDVITESLKLFHTTMFAEKIVDILKKKLYDQEFVIQTIITILRKNSVHTGFILGGSYIKEPWIYSEQFITQDEIVKKILLEVVTIDADFLSVLDDDRFDDYKNLKHNFSGPKYDFFDKLYHIAIENVSCNISMIPKMFLTIEICEKFIKTSSDNAWYLSYYYFSEHNEMSEEIAQYYKNALLLSPHNIFMLPKQFRTFEQYSIAVETYLTDIKDKCDHYKYYIHQNSTSSHSYYYNQCDHDEYFDTTLLTQKEMYDLCLKCVSANGLFLRHICYAAKKFLTSEQYLKIIEISVNENKLAMQFAYNIEKYEDSELQLLYNLVQ